MNENGQLDYNIYDLINPNFSVSDYFVGSNNPGFKNAYTEAISPKYIRDGEVYGILQSSNFVTNVDGWQIKPDGTVEFNDAIIRGTIVIGGQYRTVAVGDSIQDAIDAVNAAGGGTVVLQNGTHTPGQDITLYSKITLQGQNGDSTIIDFSGGSYQIKGIGSGAYTTGTVSVTNNGTTVTGSGTTWSGNVTVGQYILLAGIWYPISAVTDNTHLTIGVPFADVDQSGVTYTAATILSNIHLNALTIRNSAISAVKFKYVTNLFMEDVACQSSLVGTEIDTCSQITFNYSDMLANYTNYILTNTHFLIHIGNSSIDALTGNGYTIDKITNTAITACFVLNSAADGMNISNSSNCRIDGVMAENGGSGVEFVANNDNVIFGPSRVEKNASDGVKLTATSDNVFINGSFIKNNTGYGVNIVASTCDNTVINGNNFYGNTTSACNDSGTGTVIRGNVGLADNGASGSGTITKLYTAGENISQGDAVVAGNFGNSSIAIDNTSSGNHSGSSITFNHTCAGSNRLLIVAVTTDNTRSVSGITYNGTALTNIDVQTNVGATRRVEMWGLIAPATGTNSIVVTLSGVPGSFASATSASYTGVKQTGLPDAKAKSNANGTSTFSQALTTVANSCWLVEASSAAGVTATASAGTTERVTVNSKESMILDSNGAKTLGTASYTQTFTTNTNTDTAMIIASIAPATVSEQIVRATALVLAGSKGFIGFATSAITIGTTGNVTIAGEVSGLTSLTIGTQYYLSDTYGALSSSVGTNTRKAGIATSSTTLLITNIW